VRVLVTGAAGFIGTHLCAALDGRGHHVVAVDKRWGGSTADLGGLLEEMQGSLLAAPAVVDMVVHLGAQCSTSRSLADPVGDFVDNALGTVNVAEASRRAGGVPIVFTSTCKVAAGHDGRVAPLGLSKRVGEEYLRLYRQLYGVPSVILRPSTVYGPGQDGSAESGWVSWFARAVVSGLPIEVTGDGTQSRDVLFIDDMVALLVDVVEHFAAYDVAGSRQPGGVFEVGGGADNEVGLNRLLAELIRGQPDFRSDVTYVDRPPGDLYQVVSDNKAVSAVTGWKPTVGWRDGLARTYEWMRAKVAGS
jgi:nucleoside-diphosphate-sugar epimerase